MVIIPSNLTMQRYVDEVLSLLCYPSYHSTLGSHFSKIMPALTLHKFLLFVLLLVKHYFGL